jgi:hypothetical protein
MISSGYSAVTCPPGSDSEFDDGDVQSAEPGVEGGEQADRAGPHHHDVGCVAVASDHGVGS